jgi:preprotein translocase subunit SecD
MAIGVTADSFIVYFERIRDDIRDGYSLQHSVESGWTKARGTIVIADAVQLLSAIVLYILAIGSVKGFAFTLLLTTAIDLFIVFFFSKPLVTLLARTEYFANGHKWSGFDPEHLGVTREALRGRYTSRVKTTKTASTPKEA